MADITVAQLTNATDTDAGTGVFDVLIAAVNRHINQEYSEGRITGTDYATVYLGSMQSVLSESVKFLLGEQAADKQGDLIANQAATEESKKLLVEAQTLGFKTDTKQKVLKQMLDAYAAVLSLATTEPNVPETVTEQSIDQLAQEILTDVGSSVDIQTAVQSPAPG